MYPPQSTKRVVTDFDSYEFDHEGELWYLDGQLVWNIQIEDDQGRKIYADVDEDSTVSRAHRWDAGGDKIVEDLDGQDIDDALPIKMVMAELAEALEKQAIYEAEEGNFI